MLGIALEALGKGFLRYRWHGYDEAPSIYLLGLGSPTHPLPVESFHARDSTYKWKKLCGVEFLHAGPLFTHRLSQVWIDFRGIRDAFGYKTRFNPRFPGAAET